MVIAVKIAELANDDSEQARNMKDFLDYWHAQRHEQGLPGFEPA